MNNYFRHCCKECLHLRREEFGLDGFYRCSILNVGRMPYADSCADYQGKYGSTPRYLRLFKDIDTLARLIVWDKMDIFGKTCWLVSGKSTQPYRYDTKEEAVEAAKEWLLEDVPND